MQGAPIVASDVDDEPVQEIVEPDPNVDLVRGPPLAPARQLSLRVDGARPMQLRGEAICSASWRQVVSNSDGHIGDIATCLRLFLVADGSIVAHVASKPTEGLPALPVYQAAQVLDVEDLSSLLDRTTGDACFVAMPPAARTKSFVMSAPILEKSGLNLPLGPTKTQEKAQ